MANRWRQDRYSYFGCRAFPPRWLVQPMLVGWCAKQAISACSQLLSRWCAWTNEWGVARPMSGLGHESAKDEGMLSHLWRGLCDCCAPCVLLNRFFGFIKDLSSYTTIFSLLGQWFYHNFQETKSTQDMTKETKVVNNYDEENNTIKIESSNNTTTNISILNDANCDCGRCSLSKTNSNFNKFKIKWSSI